MIILFYLNSSIHGPDIRYEALFFGEYVEGSAVKEHGTCAFVDADAPLADVLRCHWVLSPPAFEAAVGECDTIGGECPARQIPFAGLVVTSDKLMSI